MVDVVAVVLAALLVLLAAAGVIVGPVILVAAVWRLGTEGLPEPAWISERLCRVGERDVLAHKLYGHHGKAR